MVEDALNLATILAINSIQFLRGVGKMADIDEHFEERKVRRQRTNDGKEKNEKPWSSVEIFSCLLPYFCLISLAVLRPLLQSGHQRQIDS